MLSYRHSYHAGNFADVFKHVALLQLVRALQRKTTPCAFVDTHAGAGSYALDSPEAQKNREYADGVLRVLASTDAPPAIADYQQQVRAAGPDRYPGSPSLLRALLRENDRLLLNELHPADHADLKTLFAGDKQVAVHKQDAYQSLKALLPPREKRGLVLIDPPYERQDEYARVVAGLQTAHQRWPNGVYALWYPILSRSLVTRLHADVQATGIHKILCAELCVRPATDRSAFVGSGMLFVSPPWQFDTALNAWLPWLWRRLAPTGEGGHDVAWLVGE